MWASRILILALAGGMLLAQNQFGRGPAAPEEPAPTGDAANGKRIFEGKGGCTSCHRIKDEGSHWGPDLSEIGARRPSQLMESITDPDAEILPANRIYRVVPKNGQPVVGRMLNQDTFTVQLIDRNEQLRSFTKSDLKEYGFETKSPMPSFKGKLSEVELTDLVTYLYSLKPPPGRGGRGRGGAPAAPRPN